MFLFSRKKEVPKLQTTVLDNGLPVVTDSSPQLGGLAVYWNMRSGTRHEKVEGSLHFLEHMFSSGYQENGMEIHDRFKEICLEHNFGTGFENVRAYAHGSIDDRHEIISSLGNVITAPRWDDGIRETQRELILNEFREDMNTPSQRCLADSIVWAYMPHPLGHKILGTEETIRNMQDEHLHDYMRDHFHAQRMALVVSSPLRHGEVVKMARAAFGRIPCGTPAPVQDTPLFHTGHKIHIPGAGPDQRAFLSYPGIAAGNADENPSCIMMGLYQSALDDIITKQGFSYSGSRCYSATYSDFGYRVISMSVQDSEKTAEIISRAYDLAMQPDRWLTQKKFDERNRKNKMSKDFAGAVNPGNRASTISFNFGLTGSIRSYEAVNADWDRISFDDLCKAYNGWNKQEFNLLSHGPVDIPTPAEVTGIPTASSSARPRG